MPVKKSSAISRQPSDKKTVVSASLRAAAKQSSLDNIPTKIATKPAASRNDKMSVPVYSLVGRAAGTMSLPKEIFGKVVNKKLLAQALRVYMTNQKNLTASTKTRGEVRGSTAKIQRQKGTGRARHGSIRAPIFVGGGIVFGPRTRNVRLDLPKRMKKAALYSALSSRAGDKGILGVSGLEKASGKTKEMAGFVKKVRGTGEIKGSMLIVTGEKMETIVRGVRNIPGIDVLPVNQLNAYEVLKHDFLVLTKDSLTKLVKPEIKEQK